MCRVRFAGETAAQSRFCTFNRTRDPRALLVRQDGCQTRSLRKYRSPYGARNQQITHMLMLTDLTDSRVSGEIAGCVAAQSRFCTGENRSRDPPSAPCAAGWVSDEKPDKYTRSQQITHMLTDSRVSEEIAGCVAAQSWFCTLNRSRDSPSAPCAAGWWVGRRVRLTVRCRTVARMMGSLWFRGAAQR